MIITIALIVFHIISEVRYIQYGNEILDNGEYEFGDDIKESDQQVIPMWHAIISFLTLTASILLVLGQFVNLIRDHVREKNYNMKQNVIETLMDKDFQIYLFQSSAKAGIAVNIIYMDCILLLTCFRPLLMIHCKTSFIYLLVAIVVVCLFFFVNGAVNVLVDSKGKFAIGDFFITC